MKVQKAWAGLLLLLPWLAGCPAPSPGPIAPLRFESPGQVRLAVGSIRIVDRFRSPLRDPHVAHRFPTPPASAARQWAADRLVAAGGTGEAVFTILDASVVETRLERSEGLRAVVTTDQTERYDATLEVSLEIPGAAGERRSAGSVTVRESRTVPEGLTLNGRRAIWNDLTIALMENFNRQMDSMLDRYFAGHIQG